MNKYTAKVLWEKFEKEMGRLASASVGKPVWTAYWSDKDEEYVEAGHEQAILFLREWASALNERGE